MARDAGVQRGTRVDLRVDGNRLVVRPVKRKSYALEELLRRVKATNLHGEIDSGPPVGREAW